MLDMAVRSDMLEEIVKQLRPKIQMLSTRKKKKTKTKKRKKQGKKEKRRRGYVTPPSPRDGSKKYFLLEMSQEIVKQLRPKKNQIFSTRKKEKRKRVKTGKLENWKMENG